MNVLLKESYRIYSNLKKEMVTDVEWQQSEALLNTLSNIDTNALENASTFDHSVLVGYIAYQTSLLIYGSHYQATRFFLAGLLHDVGKIQMNKYILNEAKRLTKEERSDLKQHVIDGVTILNEMGYKDDVIMFCKMHHERIDGSGYPYKLCNDQITMVGRIAMVSDIWSAMTLPRHYRPFTFNADDIIDYFQSKSNAFDMDVVKLARRAIELSSVAL